jgi:histidyl-tRNA synthetase
MSEKLTATKGMNDILPQDSARWEWQEEGAQLEHR